jgi:hypothetical protein
LLELDDAFGLTAPSGGILLDPRTDKKGRHSRVTESPVS